MKLSQLFPIFCVLLVGCSSFFPTADIAVKEKPLPDREYRYSNSGICGRATKAGFRVTRVIPDSPADGRVRKGDLLQRVWQYNAVSHAERAIYRTRKDHWGTMRLSIQRPLEDKEVNNITLYLKLPPLPGDRYFFGPAGFHAEVHPQHLVVTDILSGSPAEKELKKGDRVLGVNGAPLEGDLLKQFAAAIDAAESEASSGILTLEVERSVEESTTPRSFEAKLQLKPLGSYSPTAPYNCPKTDRLIRQTADRIIERGAYGDLGANLLGLLATGEKNYIEHVGMVLKSDRNKGKLASGLDMYKIGSAWRYGYRLLALTEYYLMTEDKGVLPQIKALAVTCAEGQDSAGLWNHRGANPAANFGKKHGRLYGYGAINQTSIVLWMGLILARRCGVEHPEVDMAVEKTYRLYRNWVGKGALPYGNHQPNEFSNNNNGTSGSVAIAFRLYGDQESALYYARQAAASHRSILKGHASTFFNPFWSPLGAHLLGAEVTAAYFKETRWLRTVTRTHDGEYYQQGQFRTGKLETHGCSGSALLQYCLGRKALYITGKEMDPGLWLKGKEAAQAVAAGNEDLYFLSTQELLKQLGSSLPYTRVLAAQALKVRNVEVTADIRRMLAEGDRDQRIGACIGAGVLQLDSLVDMLRKRMIDKKEDIWIRQKAAWALSSIGEAAKKSAPMMLKLIAEEEESDPLRDFDRALGFAYLQLSPEPYKDAADKELFFQAAKKLLTHKHMKGRETGARMIEKIPPEEFYRVADITRHILEDKDRTYTAYQAVGAMMATQKLWARLNIPEGLDLALKYYRSPTGRRLFKNRLILSIVPHYGRHAKAYLPRLEKLPLKQGATEETWTKMLKALESAPEPQKSLTFEEAKTLGKGHEK